MTIVKKTVATGKVIPRREIEVKSQVSGVVEKLYVVAGQTVKKGAIHRAHRVAPEHDQREPGRSAAAVGEDQPRNQALDLDRYKKLLRAEADPRPRVQQAPDRLRAAGRGRGRRRENTLLLLKTGPAPQRRQRLQHDPRDHRRHRARRAEQGRLVHPRDEHVPVGHHARDARRHDAT